MTPPAAAAANTGGRLGAAPARPARAPRPVRPAHPRRVSGPVRRPASPAAGQRPFVVIVAGALRSVSDLRLLDRLIRSKVWIGVIAFALIGIVTLQLLLLELNTGIGRALERTDVLQRENASLGIANSELAAGERVQSQALSLGMEAAPPSALRFLQVDPASDLHRALGALNTPVKAPEAQAPAGSAEAPAPAATAAPAEAEAGSGEAAASSAGSGSEGAEGAPSGSEAGAGSGEGATPGG